MELATAPLFCTPCGRAYLGNSLELLREVPARTFNLIHASPPFPLFSKKEYGNRAHDVWVEWLLEHTAEYQRVLTDDGSFVIELRGTWLPKRPVRSLCSYKLLVQMVEEQGWRLIQDVFWHNPSLLPSMAPRNAERLKTSTSTIWWLAKCDEPKTRRKEVLRPYTEALRKRARPEGHQPRHHFPSGHSVDYSKFLKNDGAIPPDCLIISNTLNNTPYLRRCRSADVKPHPARFPYKLPEFFVKFLTDEGDLCLDPFFGSGTTGQAAEELGRNWVGFEQEQRYLAASAFRFVDYWGKEKLLKLYSRLNAEGASGIRVEKEQQSLDALFAAPQQEE